MGHEKDKQIAREDAARQYGRRCGICGYTDCGCAYQLSKDDPLDSVPEEKPK